MKGSVPDLFLDKRDYLVWKDVLIDGGHLQDPDIIPSPDILKQRVP
jgi:hypothetical protein